MAAGLCFCLANGKRMREKTNAAASIRRRSGVVGGCGGEGKTGIGGRGVAMQKPGTRGRQPPQFSFLRAASLPGVVTSRPETLAWTVCLSSELSKSRARGRGWRWGTPAPAAGRRCPPTPCCAWRKSSASSARPRPRASPCVPPARAPPRRGGGTSPARDGTRPTQLSRARGPTPPPPPHGTGPSRLPEAPPPPPPPPRHRVVFPAGGARPRLGLGLASPAGAGPPGGAGAGAGPLHPGRHPHSPSPIPPFPHLPPSNLSGRGPRTPPSPTGRGRGVRRPA